MDYFQLLNLSREPFSNSPDPDFFYPSPVHVRCLQKIELAVRLRRGLNVVVGAIGTGKTTLCRHLIRDFSADNSLETHLILNPDFLTPMEFLCSLAETFGLSAAFQSENSKWQVEESIKQYLFRKGVEEEKTVVLLIDEGQKMHPFCLEILRELLNYETNESKLLQIVIFAQEEFSQTVAEHPSFADRINSSHVLPPLSFRETRNLLRFRLNQAKDGYKEPSLFTTPGMWALYRATKGYPRQIIHLSHRVLLTMIIQNRPKAGWSLVHWCSRMILSRKSFHMPWKLASLGAVLVVAVMLAVFAFNHSWFSFVSDKTRIKSAPTRQAVPPAEPPGTRRARIPDPVTAVVLPDRPASEEKAAARDPETPQNDTAPRREETAGREEATPPPTDQAGATETPSQSEPQAEQPDPTAAPIAPTPPPEAPAEPSRDSLLKAPPEASSETSPAEFHPPELLGQVTARPGDTLEKMIRRVYGFFDQPLLKTVMQLNPQITGSNALEVGRTIRFPPLPVRADPLPKDGRYVQVAEARNLNEACKLLRAYPGDATPVYLLPHWNPHEGLKFGIVLKDCCPDQATAESTLGTLPKSLATHARIVGKDDEHAVFMVK